MIALILPANDADSSLKLLAVQPEFTIERIFGQPGGEPVGSEEAVPEPGQKLLAIPVGTDAIELSLTHQSFTSTTPSQDSASNTGASVFSPSSAFGLRGVVAGSGPVLFLFIAPQLADVLATASFDGDGLIPPRRATPNRRQPCPDRVAQTA